MRRHGARAAARRNLVDTTVFMAQEALCIRRRVDAGERTMQLSDGSIFHVVSDQRGLITGIST